MRRSERFRIRYHSAMRVFGIGLSRTGTSSLARALGMLGLRTMHFPSLRFFAGQFWGLKRRELDGYDAFTDIPVIPVYKQLDRRFPGSKFVLTVRDMDPWLDSCEGYHRFQPGFEVSTKTRALRRVVYGTEVFDREQWRRCCA